MLLADVVAIRFCNLYLWLVLLPCCLIMADGDVVNNKNLHMVVPYQQGLSERIKNTCKEYGVQVYFKGGQTIKGLLMAPKDKDPITNKSGVIYR